MLVCSRGSGGLLKERMSLARSLWDAGVAAEMLPQVRSRLWGRSGGLVPVALPCHARTLHLHAAHFGWTPLCPRPSTQAAPSLTEQYEYAQTRGIPWLVIINASTFGGAWRDEAGQRQPCPRSAPLPALGRHRGGVTSSPPLSLSPPAAADTVRVKAMHARLEEDVSVSDLASYLLAALHPHSTAPLSGSRKPYTAGGRLGDDADAAGEPEEQYGGRERQRRGGRR